MAPGQTPNSTGTGWTVTGQQETTEIWTDQKPHRGVRVQFTATAGGSGSVFLPDELYQPANVRAAIAQRVAAMNEVGGLSG